MQLSSKRERYMVIFCVVFLALAAALKLAPSSSQGAPGTLLPTSVAEARWQSQAAKYRALVDEQQAIAPKLRRITYHQSPETVVALVTQELQTIAAHSGVHLHDTRPLQSVKMPFGDIVRVPLEIHFRAAFQPEVMRFLYSVEAPTSKMVVDRLDINPADSRFKQVEVSARISVFTQSVAGTTGTGEGETGDDTESPGQG